MEKALSRVGGEFGWREFGEGASARFVGARPALWGDAAIGRKDVSASYHIACVVDDAAQGVSEVVRGADLFEATSLHRLLQTLLGLPAPDYRHHRLVCDETGRKLAKSRQSPSLRDRRARGARPEDICALLERTMGLPAWREKEAGKRKGAQKAPCRFLQSV